MVPVLGPRPTVTRSCSKRSGRKAPILTTVPPVFTVYHVAADTPDERSALCRAFEPEPLRSGLRISEIVETARHVMSKGVHQVGPYHHFGRDLHD